MILHGDKLEVASMLLPCMVLRGDVGPNLRATLF